MKPVYYYSALLLSLLLFGSCTIEKRLHQPGWHVEWRKKLSGGDHEKADPKNQASIVVDSAPISTETANEIAPVESASIREAKPTIEEELFSASSGTHGDDATVFAERIETESVDDTIKRKVVVIDESELRHKTGSTDSEIRDPLTILLWTLTILSMILISASVLLILFASPSSVVLLAFLFAELPLLVLVRAILAVFIRKRERDQPGTYRHSDNVVLAVILPEIYLILIGVLLFLLLLLLL